MKKMEHTADFTLWTPWGPQITAPVRTKAAALRRTLKRLKTRRTETDKREGEDMRVGKPECAYEP